MPEPRADRRPPVAPRQLAQPGHADRTVRRDRRSGSPATRRPRAERAAPRCTPRAAPGSCTAPRRRSASRRGRTRARTAAVRPRASRSAATAAGRSRRAPRAPGVDAPTRHRWSRLRSYTRPLEAPFVFAVRVPSASGALGRPDPCAMRTIRGDPGRRLRVVSRRHDEGQLQRPDEQPHVRPPRSRLLISQARLEAGDATTTSTQPLDLLSAPVTHGGPGKTTWRLDDGPAGDPSRRRRRRRVFGANGHRRRWRRNDTVDGGDGDDTAGGRATTSSPADARSRRMSWTAARGMTGSPTTGPTATRSGSHSTASPTTGAQARTTTSSASKRSRPAESHSSWQEADPVDFSVTNTPSGNSTLIGSPGNDKLRSGAYDDRIEGEGQHRRDRRGQRGRATVGGPGPDAILADGGVICDFISCSENRQGNDSIDARDGEKDSIECGPGTDAVLADAVDVTTGCETVNGVPSAGGPPPGGTPPREHPAEHQAVQCAEGRPRDDAHAGSPLACPRRLQGRGPPCPLQTASGSRRRSLAQERTPPAPAFGRDAHRRHDHGRRHGLAREALTHASVGGAGLGPALGFSAPRAGRAGRWRPCRS